MINILTHKQFTTLTESVGFHDIKEDDTTNTLFESYLNDEISYDDFETNFLKVNESIISDVKSKVFTLLNRILDNIKTLGTKVIGLLNTVFKLIKGFIKSNPKLFKVIIILIVIMLLSTSAALASTNNPNESIMVLEAAVGYLNQIPTTDFSAQELLEAKGTLLAVKQHLATSLDDDTLRSMFSDKSIAMAKTAKKMVLEMNTSETFDLWKDGKDLVLDYMKNINSTIINVHK